MTTILETVLLEKTPLERYVPPAKPSLVGLTRMALAEALGAIGVAPSQQKMRVQQLWHWIYVRGATSFSQMTSVSKELHAVLDAHYTLARPEVVAEQVSQDGTRKWLLRLPGEVDGERPHEVECVYIPESDRGTLCVSSQVGCTLTCSFCHTGTQRLVRNLTPGEIVGQVMVARDRLGDFIGMKRAEGVGVPTGGERCVSNIVMMGMGEPLYNFEAVRDALAVVQDGDGIAISKRRITLSTSGVVPMIERAGAEIGVNLAISLHAVRDELRETLVPLNRKYPIAELLDACRNYPGVSNARRITFEYVMLKDVNDSLDDAKALVRLLKGIPAKINLIPFNPWPGSNYECSDWDQIEKFSEIVFNAGYASPVRTPRGRDILAACDRKTLRPRAAGAARHGDDGLSLAHDHRPPADALPAGAAGRLHRHLRRHDGGAGLRMEQVCFADRRRQQRADGLRRGRADAGLLDGVHAAAGDTCGADCGGLRDPLAALPRDLRRAVGMGEPRDHRRARQGLRPVRRAADRCGRGHRCGLRLLGRGRLERRLLEAGVRPGSAGFPSAAAAGRAV
jgi:23S rRNA (adenine2503-C2)-methyltransferase